MLTNLLHCCNKRRSLLLAETVEGKRRRSVLSAASPEPAVFLLALAFAAFAASARLAVVEIARQAGQRFRRLRSRER